jgi:hypothetical protein
MKQNITDQILNGFDLATKIMMPCWIAAFAVYFSIVPKADNEKIYNTVVEKICEKSVGKDNIQTRNEVIKMARALGYNGPIYDKNSISLTTQHGESPLALLIKDNFDVDNVKEQSIEVPLNKALKYLRQSDSK